MREEEQPWQLREEFNPWDTALGKAYLCLLKGSNEASWLMESERVFPAIKCLEESRCRAQDILKECNHPLDIYIEE